MRISDMADSLVLSGQEYVPIFDPNQLDLADQNRKVNVQLLKGLQGERGFRGLSAYEVWLNRGYTGTVDDFLNSLKGQDGQNGTNGLDGKSSYQSWLDVGNTGSEADFVNSLKGDSAYQVWLDAGHSGNTNDFLEYLRGPRGYSAYEQWQQAGNAGTIDDFLTSLIGKSAYDIWIDAGNAGDESDFLASLVGQDGTQGPQGPQGPQGVQGPVGSKWYEGDDVPVNTTGINGDYYLNVSTGDVYVKVAGAWGSPVGNIRGPAGLDGDAQVGPQGPQGKSAYEVWLDAGNTGTVSDYLASLKGAQGDQGPQGPAGQGIATGGVVGQVLIKTAAANYATGWSNLIGIPGGGSVGQSLTKLSNTSYDVTWSSAPGIYLLDRPVDYTPGLLAKSPNSDTWIVYDFTNPGANAPFNVAAQATYAIMYVQLGTGGGPDYIYSRPNGNTNVQYQQTMLMTYGGGSSDHPGNGTIGFAPLVAGKTQIYNTNTDRIKIALLGYITTGKIVTNGPVSISSF